MDRAMALDEAASALRSLTPELAVASSCMYLMIGFMGVPGREMLKAFAGGDLLRRRDMVDIGRAALAQGRQKDLDP